MINDPSFLLFPYMLSLSCAASKFFFFFGGVHRCGFLCFILLWVLWSFWICGLIFHSRFRKSKSLFLQILILPHFLFLHFLETVTLSLTVWNLFWLYWQDFDLRKWLRDDKERLMAVEDYFINYSFQEKRTCHAIWGHVGNARFWLEVRKKWGKILDQSLLEFLQKRPGREGEAI